VLPGGGALGTVVIVQSWLIGVGWVIYGGQLFGRCLAAIMCLR
jgi:hypothetical protein